MMLSLRNAARALPKSILQTRTAINSRALSTLRRPAPLQQSLRASALPLRSAFSTSFARYAEETTESEVDQELSSILASELQLEKESTEAEGLPSRLSEFLESSGFSIQDQPGNEEVALTKSFGKEKITVTFSISDVNAEHNPDSYMQDQAMQDASFEEAGGVDGHGKRPINAGKTGEFDTAPEDSIAQSDREASGLEEQMDSGFPVNINVTIEKEGSQGAMQFMTSASDGQVMIEQFSFFRDASLADAKTAEEQWSSRNLYSGPPYLNLDERLQETMERYLDERGINTALALWIPDYIDYKEQQEYMKWLEDTKSFVDA